MNNATESKFPATEAEAIQKAIDLEELIYTIENEGDLYDNELAPTIRDYIPILLSTLKTALEIEQGKAFVARWENVKEEHANGKWLIASCEEGFHDSNIDVVYNGLFGWENGEADMCLDVKKVMTFNNSPEIPQPKEEE